MGKHYTKMKIFHFKDKIDSLPLAKSNIIKPIHVRIKPTTICSHNCYYCAYKSKNQQLGRDMGERENIPREKIIEITNDIIEMEVDSVTFSGGGDPFYYPHLIDSVKLLADSEVKFAAITNGSNLKGELADVFALHATWLRISVDGWDDRSYANYRGVSEKEFSKIMGNMESFKRTNGSCYLGISIIVDEKNAEHLYELIKKIKSMGAGTVKVSPCIISNDSQENKKYHEKIFHIVNAQVSRAISSLSSDEFEIYNSYHFGELDFKKDYSWCPFLQILPVIGADLNIYSCQDKAFNLDCGLIGSIKDRRFKDFWFSDKNKFFKINPSIDCNHRCVANNKNSIIHEYLDADRIHLGFV